MLWPASEKEDFGQTRGGGGEYRESAGRKQRQAWQGQREGKLQKGRLPWTKWGCEELSSRGLLV